MEARDRILQLSVYLFCFAILILIGQAISVLPFKIAIVLVVGLVAAFLTIINVEIGLFILIFIVPFTQQIRLGRFGIGPIDIGTDDVLIIFILLSWLAGLARRKEPIFLKTPLNWPIFAFFSVAVFSFFGANARFGAGTILVGFLHLFKFFEYVVIYFVVVSTINNLKQIRRFILMFFIVAGSIAIMQFIIMIRVGHFSLTGMGGLAYRLNLFMQLMHTFQSNAVLGAYYAFFLSILLAILLDTPVSKGKVPLVLFALLFSFALFNTYSRSSYLGILVSFFVIAMLKEKRLFLIILLLLIFSPIYMQSIVLERITYTVQSLKPITLDVSSLARLELWKKGIEVFLNNAILGTGYWTTRYVLHAEAHNQYLAILIETGIVGLSIFMWMIVRMFKNAANLMRRATTDFFKSLGVGYIGGLAAITTTCFFSETLEAFRMIGPLWFVTGLITSANRLLSEKGESLD